MDKLIVLYTMNGCPHCETMKQKLNENKISFVERDINVFEKEYDMFTEITENDYVPAFMVIESFEETPKTYFYAPERDFNELEDGIEILKEHLKK